MYRCRGYAKHEYGFSNGKDEWAPTLVTSNDVDAAVDDVYNPLLGTWYRERHRWKVIVVLEGGQNEGQDESDAQGLLHSLNFEKRP
jgi:hypothetical protein